MTQQQRLYVSQGDLAIWFGVCRRTIWTWRKTPDFPQPAPLPGRPKWRISDIEEYERRQQEVGGGLSAVRHGLSVAGRRSA